MSRPPPPRSIMRPAIATCAGLAAAYYLIAVRRKPTLRHSHTPLNAEVVRRLSILHEPYTPPVWAFNAWVQLAVILARMKRAKKETPFTRTVLTAPDGGSVGIDVLEDDSLPVTAPVLVLCQTITGLSREHVQLAIAARKLGWRTAVCVRRGHLGTPLTAARVNLLGCTADLRLQIDAISSRYPGAPLLGVGISAGSGLLVRYLGEEGPRSKMAAAAALYPGYNTAPSTVPGKGNAFDRMAGPADKQITASLKRFFLRHDILRPVPGYEAVLAAPTIAAYQAAAYALEGYESVEAMYEKTNPMAVADNIRTPMLVLNAEDDPVCVWQNVVDNLHIFDGPHDRLLVSTSHGSHCAHLEGMLWPAKLGWHERLALEYLQTVLAIRAEQAAPA